MTDISGTVLTDDGFSIENAIVTLCSQVAYTDNMGKFSLHNVAVGTLYMVVEHRDFDQYVRSLMVMEDQPDLIITMNRIATIQTGK